MGRALYRKYRSKSLDEIIGQSHITDTLRNAIKDGNISHAYLFTGPRGVGKTSIARILAHEINQLPYDDDSTHLDIIEIDAASNRRIDEIRELRERVHVAPTSAKYKVYIIDEVHMLTKEAFNALLKTLEEPPAHVVFILATTEAHKLPETIVSRTQRYTFKPVESNEVVAHLKFISKTEGFSVDDPGLELIAQHGGGSFRDSISLLDQIKSRGSDASLADVQTVLGIAPDTFLRDILQALASADAVALLQSLNSAKEQGYQAAQLAKQLSARLRESLVSNEPLLDSNVLVELLGKLLSVPTKPDQMASLELALIDVVLRQNPTKAVASPPVTASPVEDIVEDVEPKIADVVPPKSTVKAEPPQLKAKKATVSKSADVALDTEIWNQALDSLKKTHNTLYSVARMAQPSIDKQTVTLTFKFAFHQKRLNETKNQQVLSSILEKLVGKPVVITCVIGEVTEGGHRPEKATQTVDTDSKNTVSTISNIFGGAEVLD